MHGGGEAPIYRVELHDAQGLRRGAWTEVDALEIIRTPPDRADRIIVELPIAAKLGWTVQVWLDNRLTVSGTVTHKLVLASGVVEVVAEQAAFAFDNTVTARYDNWFVGDIAADLIERASGPLHCGSIASGPRIGRFEAAGSVYGAMTLLAYGASGWAWSVDPMGQVRFRPAEQPDRVIMPEARGLVVRPERTTRGVVNTLTVAGHPLLDAVGVTATRPTSVAAYGPAEDRIEVFALPRAADRQQFAEGLLDDLAYADVADRIDAPHGYLAVEVGDLVALRGSGVADTFPQLAGQWGDRFDGEQVGRVRTVRHRIRGVRLETALTLMPPLRSVTNPLAVIRRSQPAAGAYFQFGLDDPAVGLDSGRHLD